ILADLTVFNANKERAFIKKGKDGAEFIGKRIVLLRRDIPDTGADAWGKGSETGIAYGIDGASDHEVSSPKLLEVFANPHASTLERLSL
ncbi:MAG: hypothetical protein HOO67_06820, partial [Candidatus Peribacteraceae bacterium]|nr:hypothetical protein [Candidatus Peribacteraceae bacterium]